MGEGSNLLGQKEKDWVGCGEDKLHEFIQMRFQDLQEKHDGVMVRV